MWWFFSAGILFSSLLLYTSMQTSFVQPGTWVELKHNWEVVRYRFPEYEKMNKTVAIAEAGRYYKNTISVVGALLWCLFILISTVTYCAGRVLSCREVSKYILHISSVVGMIISAVLAGYAISLAGKPDQFGLSADLIAYAEDAEETPFIYDLNDDATRSVFPSMPKTSLQAGIRASIEFFQAEN